MFTDLKSLKKQEVKSPNKIKIAALTRKICDKAPVLLKYFRVGNVELDRFHIPEISAERYEEIAKEFKRTPKFNELNLKFATATEYYIRKARVIALAKDLEVSPSLIDTTGYYWDENMYTEYNFWHNVDVVEDAWREEGEDLRYANSWTVYIDMDAKSALLDTDAFNMLYNFCYTAMITRKAMLLFKVDKCISLLQNIVEYTNGFSENVTAAHSAAMRSYITFFTDLLTNSDASKFIRENTDVTVFAEKDATHNDYVETYRAMLRALTRCGGDELEFFREEMSKVDDPYLEELLNIAEDPEDWLSGSYLNNEDGEEDWENWEED